MLCLLFLAVVATYGFVPNSLLRPSLHLISWFLNLTPSKRFGRWTPGLWKVLQPVLHPNTARWLPANVKALSYRKDFSCLAPVQQEFFEIPFRGGLDIVQDCQICGHSLSEHVDANTELRSVTSPGMSFLQPSFRQDFKATNLIWMESLIAQSKRQEMKVSWGNLNHLSEPRRTE